MKRLFCTLAILGFLLTCEKDLSPVDKECFDPDRVREDAVCTAQYDPVCGCDGKTYSNECRASSAGILNWTKGACED